MPITLPGVVDGRPAQVSAAPAAEGAKRLITLFGIE